MYGVINGGPRLGEIAKHKGKKYIKRPKVHVYCFSWFQVGLTHFILGWSTGLLGTLKKKGLVNAM